MSDGVLPPRETLTVEFKSDLKRLPDHELVEAIVCLANADIELSFEFRRSECV